MIVTKAKVKKQSSQAHLQYELLNDLKVIGRVNNTGRQSTRMKTANIITSCPTFQNQESVLNDITTKINGAKDASTQVKFAEELLKEVEMFLDCSGYDLKSRNCNNCRYAANVCKATAHLIIKAKKIVA